MDKLDKLIAELLSPLFEGWKPYLTKEEQVVFGLTYFKDYSQVKIAMEINYSERQIRRILKSAKRKINKLLP